MYLLYIIWQTKPGLEKDGKINCYIYFYHKLKTIAEEVKLTEYYFQSLRKGASEFAELLQEAQLMSNFRHENIVRLIGVSCDAESVSIIMEHMEGGDLLTYLRESRSNLPVRRK